MVLAILCLMAQHARDQQPITQSQRCVIGAKIQARHCLLSQSGGHASISQLASFAASQQMLCGALCQPASGASNSQ